MDDEVYEHIHLLVERKWQGEELGMGAPDPVLNAFIAVCLDHFATPLPEQHRKRQEFRMLDDVLTTILEEIAL